MTYKIISTSSCKKAINKATKKNRVLRKAITNKIAELVANPHRQKNLRHELSGEKRVHILSSFVLRFEVDEKNKSITLIDFSHHDDAYKL